MEAEKKIPLLSDDVMAEAVKKLGKESTAPDCDTPDWLMSDIRRGMILARDFYEQHLRAAEEKMKWVDAKERLPEKEVLAINYHNEILIGYVSTVNGEYYCENDYEMLVGVTHWMELPAAPMLPVTVILHEGKILNFCQTGI